MSDMGAKDSHGDGEMAAPPSVAQQPRVFIGQPNVGRFVVTRAVQTPLRRESHIAGLFVLPYVITLQVEEVLPAVSQKSFVMRGSKGEGVEAGELGLQDWLPTNIGEECVLAFDPSLIESAERVIFLGGGANVESVWQSAKRFYESLRPKGGLDPSQVVVALEKGPLPRSTFFQLVFDYDRSVYQNADVTRALGTYLVNPDIPALDRRTTVAHYMGQPNARDIQALRGLVAGLFQLALQLASAGQTASTGVVLQRVYGYSFDAKTNVGRFTAPGLTEAHRVALEELLDNPGNSLNAEVARSLRHWIAQ